MADVAELLDVLHGWFDDGGDPDTLRDQVEMVIAEREETINDEED